MSDGRKARRPALSKENDMKALRFATGLIAAGLLTIGFGCDRSGSDTDAKVTTQTEVKDKLLGGKEIKKTTIVENGDRTSIKEEKTELNADGSKRKSSVEEKSTTPPPTP